MNPCAEPKKSEFDEDGYPIPDLTTRIMNSKTMLIIQMLASFYTVNIGWRAYNAIGVGSHIFLPCHKHLLTFILSLNFFLSSRHSGNCHNVITVIVLLV